MTRASRPGRLRVVATPIGNLEELSPRARRALAEADLVAAEDTRHTGRLLTHFGIDTPRFALHEHNEREAAERLVARLAAGENIALVSDAGTPLVSDPGYRLVRAATEAGIEVTPIAGPCAAIAALSVAGLPTDRFVFEGFLPARPAARRERLAVLAGETRTLVFYESVHRVTEAVADMAAALGAERRSVVARELTKRHESLHRGALAQAARALAGGEIVIKGEFVIVVEGAAPRRADDTAGAERLLRILLGELPLKQAVRLAAEVSGEARNALYRRALELADE